MFMRSHVCKNRCNTQTLAAWPPTPRILTRWPGLPGKRYYGGNGAIDKVVMNPKSRNGGANGLSLSDHTHTYIHTHTSPHTHIHTYTHTHDQHTRTLTHSLTHSLTTTITKYGHRHHASSLGGQTCLGRDTTAAMLSLTRL